MCVSLPLLVVLLVAPAPAQELILRNFGPLDGLAHERVNDTLEDPRGYLWVATWEGVSRFDGRNFVNYGTPEGLAVALVFELAIDPEGRLWVAPHGSGVARLDERAEGGARFRCFRVGSGGESGVGAGDVDEENVAALVFDEKGLWAGTAAGVFRAREREEPRFEAAWRTSEPLELQAAFRAGERGWMVGVERVLELSEEGVRVHAGCGGAPPRDSVRAAASSDGRVLLVGREGLFVFDAAAARRGAEPWQRLAFELAPEEVVHATAIDARGRYWLATIEGLLVLEGVRARRITQAQGLSDDWLRGLAFDRAGTLWLGSNQGGLTGLSEPAISTFRGAHERERMNLARVLQASDGRVYVSASDRGILRLEEAGLVPVSGSQVEPFRNVHVRFFQDRSGDWWLGGTAEVWRVRGPKLELARAEAVWHEGGPGVLGEFFQGADGRIWIGGSDQGLYALEPAADAPGFQRVLRAADLDGAFPRMLLAGPDGSTWIATNTALFRRRGGQLERVRPRGALALEELAPRALLLDSRGWLWVGTRHAGLAYTREPDVKEPVFTRLSLRQGLPSDHIPALAEDEHGRIWIGTGRGLVRFDPENASLRLFTTADGLAGETVNHLIRDRNGVLWAAVAGGLSRVDPSVEPAPSLPPPVRIRRFEAGGRSLPVPESGSVHLAGLELSPSERAVVVAYAGIDLAHGGTLRFQQRLEGLDADWSEPSTETSVSYGSLAPRSYRFLVRALTHDGVASAAPAVVEFRLAAPLWQRPWFLVVLTLALAGGLWGVQLLRAGRRRALERIRTQIATDLHDEVGAGLAQIAVLTEVARRVGAETSSAQLGEVAELARATRSSMADLVWAIDPRRDTLRDLLQRLHGVTANLFTGAGLELVLRMPSEAELDGLALAPDRRRHLLLFFKEAAQNVARHARATRVEIELVVTSGRTGRRLRLALRDDGSGFDPSARTEGQGLASLRRRARLLGGELVLESAPGRGTRVELDVVL